MTAGLLSTTLTCFSQTCSCVLRWVAIYIYVQHVCLRVPEERPYSVGSQVGCHRHPSNAFNIPRAKAYSDSGGHVITHICRDVSTGLPNFCSYGSFLTSQFQIKGSRENGALSLWCCLMKPKRVRQFQIKKPRKWMVGFPCDLPSKDTYLLKFSPQSLEGHARLDHLEGCGGPWRSQLQSGRRCRRETKELGGAKT